MRNILIFILGCSVSYLLLYQGREEIHDLWKVAYKIGKDDGTSVAKAQYQWTEERLSEECMLLHFEKDEKRRSKLGLKGLGQ